MSLEHERLLAQLTRLNLRTVRDRLDTALDEAARRDLSFRAFLAELCDMELSARDQRRVHMQLRIAHFPFLRTLEGFDYASQPSVDRKQMEELALGRWVVHGDNLVLQGPPGVGKTHLAIALGKAIIEQGHAVLFAQAAELLAQLVKAQSQGRLEEKLALLCKPKLLIIDELGYLPFERSASNLFFQLVARRYEKGSILLTSNRAISEWGEVFGDVVLATAILDRLLHHSHVVTIRGESYRLKEKRKSGLARPAAGTAGSSGT